LTQEVIPQGSRRQYEYLLYIRISVQQLIYDQRRCTCLTHTQLPIEQQPTLLRPVDEVVCYLSLCLMRYEFISTPRIVTAGILSYTSSSSNATINSSTSTSLAIKSHV